MFRIKNRYYRNNIRKIKKQQKLYRSTHKITIAIQKKKWYNKNRKKILINKEIYRKKNHKILSRKSIIYITKKLRIDKTLRILFNLRSRIYKVLKGNPKLSTTTKLIGCSIDKLKHHLESKFTKGMSWSNYGTWHIDHIKPCASFDLSKPSEQRKCFNYKNLQPLWAKDNLSKGKNYGK